jgi:hypothetical protein
MRRSSAKVVGSGSTESPGLAATRARMRSWHRYSVLGRSVPLDFALVWPCRIEALRHGFAVGL